MSETIFVPILKVSESKSVRTWKCQNLIVSEWSETCESVRISRYKILPLSDTFRIWHFQPPPHPALYLPWSCFNPLIHVKQPEKNTPILFCFILLIYERPHRKVYRDFQPSYDILCRSGAKGSLDGRSFLFTPSRLHCQPIANPASTQSQQPVNRTRLLKSSRL